MPSRAPAAKPPDLDEIASAYGRMVSAVCRNMIQDPHAAEDAAQETWVEITRSIGSFRARSKISTWIYSITRRVVLRHARKERQYTTRHLRRFFRADEPSPGFPDERLEYTENVKAQCAKCLVGILHCLDNESRLAYVMRDMAGLSYGEVAAVLARPEPTVRKIVSRSRDKLRRFLKEECFLFNPGGNCRCRMIRHARAVRLDREFDRLRRTVHKMRFFKDAQEVLPGRNYWEALSGRDGVSA